MKCIECEFYFPAQGDCEAGCTDGGDVFEPEKDVYCSAAGDKQGDYGFSPDPSQQVE